MVEGRGLTSLKTRTNKDITMAKRFHDTDIWDEDWFIATPRDYRDLWLFIKDKCDHAGIWRPNVTTFNKLYDLNVDKDKALKLFNSDKERIVVLDNGRWLLVDFIAFQYGDHLNLNNRVHASILKLLNMNEVNLTSIRGLNEDMQGLKDKDKDKDSIKAVDNNNISISDTEYQCLIDHYGSSTTKEYIERLKDYAAQFPDRFKKYHSHYATIRNWMRRDGIKRTSVKHTVFSPEGIRFDPKVADLIKNTKIGVLK